jgi:hypothetical protein
MDKHPIDDWVVNGDIVFDAVFDFHDLFKALQEDFPDLTERQVKGVMYSVLADMVNKVENLLWDAAGRL